jgi:hypothetical protein
MVKVVCQPETEQKTPAPIEDYRDLIVALRPHAEALQPPVDLTVDTDIIKKIADAAQGYHRIAAYIIDHIIRHRILKKSSGYTEWPESLGYWITVVREETVQYLRANRST